MRARTTARLSPPRVLAERLQASQPCLGAGGCGRAFTRAADVRLPACRQGSPDSTVRLPRRRQVRRALERVAELLVMGGWELRARGGWELARCCPRAASRSADASRLVCAERYGGLGPPAKRGLPPGAPKATGSRKQKKSHASAGSRSGVGNFGGFVASVGIIILASVLPRAIASAASRTQTLKRRI